MKYRVYSHDFFLWFSLPSLVCALILFIQSNFKSLKGKAAIAVKTSSILIDKIGLKNRTGRIATTGKRDTDDSMRGLTSNRQHSHLTEVKTGLSCCDSCRRANTHRDNFALLLASKTCGSVDCALLQHHNFTNIIFQVVTKCERKSKSVSFW